MMVTSRPRHPKNPHIQPTIRPMFLGDVVHCISVHITISGINGPGGPHPLREIHPHKWRHAKLRRMQAVRKAQRMEARLLFGCPNTECPTKGYVYIERGVLRTPLSNITCNCGKVLIPKVVS